jgi:hypothetical protein
MQDRRMIEQNNSEINQVTRRHPRVMLYVKTGNGPSHEDFANVQDDDDVAFLEKRWGLPIFADQPQMVIFRMLLNMHLVIDLPLGSVETDPADPAFGSKKGFEADTAAKDLPTFNEFLSKPLAEQKRQTVFEFRDSLRQAWRGDPKALRKITHVVQMGLAQTGTKLISNKKGQLELTADNPLAIACILFLRDFGAGRLALCANPSCTSPFFVRSRRTQKFCDVPACMVYSHRLSANKHWAKVRAKKKRKR